MVVLALDTTTRAGSLAVRRQAVLLEEHVGDASRTHGERLPDEIDAILKRHGLRVGDVDLYAVAAGPGSFTGLRVGIAAIQGLALVHGRSVVAVSALDALARVARARRADEIGPEDLVVAWMDAQRGEVFAALYAARGDIAPLAEPAVGAPAWMLQRDEARLSGQTSWFVGDGAERYRDVIRARLAAGAHVIAPTPALAGAIAALAVERAAAGQAIAPHAIRPLYIRRPDAELARDRNPH